jgi:hypothetical protein
MLRAPKMAAEMMPHGYTTPFSDYKKDDGDGSASRGFGAAFPRLSTTTVGPLCCIDCCFVCVRVPFLYPPHFKPLAGTGRHWHVAFVSLTGFVATISSGKHRVEE